MTLNEYQKLAARTINPRLVKNQMEDHALKGMGSELGEINGIYQKVYQDHPMDYGHVKKELGDLMWFVAEYCTSQGWNMDDVAQLNIDKLRARFPEGFEADKSLHRAAGDI